MFNTKVQLFNNVPFSQDYQHTRWFSTKAEQTNYFNSLSPIETVTNGRAVKISEGVIRVQGYADSKDYFNYCIIDNRTSENLDNRLYYCFVKQVKMINVNVYEIEFDIDVLQTYLFDLQFKQSFVERQHGAVTTLNEGLNLGDTYQTLSEQRLSKQIDNFFTTLVITTTKPIHTTEGDLTKPVQSLNGIANGVASPLSYYLVLVPKNNTTRTTLSMNGQQLYGGATTTLDILRPIFSLFSDERTINSIVSINYLPLFPFETTGGSGSYSIVDTGLVGAVPLFVASDDSIFRILTLGSDTTGAKLTFNLSLELLLNGVTTTEPKLKQSPYTKLVLNDNLGGILEIKPEYLSNQTTLTIHARTIFGSINRVVYEIEGYMGNTYAIDHQLISTINADVEIINDHTATYMQGRRNSDRMAQINNVFGSILQGAIGVGMTVASTGIGQPLGVVSGVGMTVSAVQNMFQGQSQILAKHEDIENVPPSLSGQGGLATWNIAHNYILPVLSTKSIHSDTIQQLEGYFKQYGYKTSKMTTINLRTKTHFNFIKTIGCNVVGSVPQLHLQLIKRIFDQGITLWHVNDVYNYNVNNVNR